ncbi:efflux RND transporter permease subunit [Pedobacter montanisoli]|uniref:Efflux RND transporter permease subunit n=1 Tax=Pedobacter montanisoli TaxID=2923277 RepID=A0ABS9ZWE2_9SPHI|nr:efflux RND transporter permease subunit [Pedobacter montanisoli]MCJ0742630.1 efflux RND transporter permease subunit [Pedobacter montanisoli]
MKISEYAVKNYQFTLIIMLMLLVLGITTVLNMPRAEDPDMNAPNFPVVAVYPGASPKDMEELVVKPLEKRIYGLDNIKSIKTTIRDGLAVIFVEYKYNVNVENKYQELIREINIERANLPKEIYSLEVQKVSPSDVNVLQIALISQNASRSNLKTAAEKLQSELEKVPTLKNVAIVGLPDQEVRVDLNLDKMAQLRLPVTFIANAIQSEVANIPGGSVNAGNKSFNIKTSGNYQNIDEIKNTIVFSAGGKNIMLKDVANVYFDYSQDKHLTRLNSYRCVFVVAALKSGSNISQSQDKYLPAINQFKDTLPNNIDMQVMFDQAENVNTRLSGLGVDFMIAITLVLITLLPLGTRASIVVMVSIPLSLAIGIILVNLLGFSLNQLSIVGLVVSLGLLVDDSIVVVENIERWMREGHSRIEATFKATKQIGLAVIGCTATLIIAFMPLMFMPEASGEFIRSLPVAVMSSVLGSMFVALTIVPFLSSKILKPHQDPAGNIVLKTLQKIIHGTYARLLDKALHKPVVTIIVAVIIFGGSLALIPVIGFSLFPSSEKPQFLINISTPLQSNLHYTDSIAKQIEQELKTIPEVKYFATNVGKGNPRIYYNVLQQNERSDFSEIFVLLKDDITADKKVKLIENLRKKWSPYPGAKIEVKDFEQGQPIVSPVEVRLFGDDLDTLRHLSAKVEELLKQTEGTIYVNNPLKNLKSDIKVEIDKEKANALGIATVNIDRTVRMALAGVEVGKFVNPNANSDDYSIILTTSRPANPTLKVLENLYVNNNQGVSIPLSQIATLKLETSAISINHQNKERTTSVNAFVKRGYLNDRVIKEVEQQMQKMKLPKGYEFAMGGEVESRNQSFGGFGSIILITVFLFIAVLVLEFKTFKSTLIVLSVIPLGIVGAVLALLVTGNSLSFVATIGIVALAGIEVKNTILLVDFTNQLRAEGKGLNQAIEEAGEVRFLPIILTTFTAIGGLLPIALSSNPLISPLAIVMIGGLISSTLLSRIVTPVVYKLMPPKI